MDDTVPLHSRYQDSKDRNTEIKIGQRLPARSDLRNKKRRKVTNVFVKCDKSKVLPYLSTNSLSSEIEEKAWEMIELEKDEKYKKKYAPMWKKV